MNFVKPCILIEDYLSSVSSMIFKGSPDRLTS